ncbi:MAG: TIM barrel protein [Bryobacteraceae bacterium]
MVPTRRTAVGVLMAAPALAATRSAMGVATTCYLTAWRPRDTYEFLEHCIALGAGGIQASLSSTDPAFVRKLRGRLEKEGMYFEAMAGLPKQDAGDFEHTVVAAKQAGALCIRSACLSGRRYETFHSVQDWQRFITDSRAAIARALPIVEKHRLPLALENHKDWTVGEMAALLKDKSSEYLGVCLDCGNNISLLDDPMAVVETLAPYALSTHVKDMGVRSIKDGFLLSEVPFGEGFLDIKRILELVRRVRPKTRITLEMITRNPLVVPCLTEKYWATFGERNGVYLARTLTLVRANERNEPLTRIDGMDHDAQLRLEDDNVKRCLQYAREKLGL